MLHWARRRGTLVRFGGVHELPVRECGEFLAGGLAHSVAVPDAAAAAAAAAPPIPPPPPPMP